MGSQFSASPELGQSSTVRSCQEGTRRSISKNNLTVGQLRAPPGDGLDDEEVSPGESALVRRLRRVDDRARLGTLGQFP